jgi:exopolyphosphatase / guanosine-5'-triphosphate,3'-diphosphate pyrophosphatase
VMEIAETVATQVRLAQEVGAEAIRTVATAAIREADNRDDVVAEIERVAGVDVEVLSEHEEGRLAFVGATKTLGHPVAGEIGVVDVGGGSTEVITGTIAGGVQEVHSFAVGSGLLADTFLSSDPPAASELRAVREHIAEFFEAADFPHPEQAVAVGGSATSLRKVVGAVLEYETLERAMRVFSSDEVAEVARRFELDPTRVRILPTGVLLLEKLSELLGQPLQIGKGGLREGVILDLLNGSANGDTGGASGAELA